MDTRPRISIAPAPEQLPTPAPMPAAEAWRWNSDFDADGLQLAVKVFLTQPACVRVRVHAASDLDNEVGGVLVGQWYQDQALHEQFIVIDQVIPARFTRHGPVSLTFTQKSLVYFHNTIEKRYPDRRIVGWYHTHPRLNVFMSHFDTFLHHSFFPEPWQVAMVVEPYTSTAGFFIRQTNGQLDPMRYFGFYELNGALGYNLVHWENLSRESEERE